MAELMTSSLLLAALTSSGAIDVPSAEHDDAPTYPHYDEWSPTRVAQDDEPAPGLTVETTTATEPERGWHYEGFYAATGIAPGTTFDLDGINPMLRYDLEMGMHWQREKWNVSFGADAWILQYYERKKPGFGVHGVVTISRRPVYMRIGAGSLTGIPGTPDDNDYRPAVGALAGFGLEGGGPNLTGRFGFDYHISLDKAGRVNNTVLLALRLKF